MASLLPILPREGAGVSEASGILRSYVSLVRRLSGAASVSLYVPPGPVGEREILLHDGRLDPLPELADAESAARFDVGPGRGPADAGEGAVRLASRCAGGVLCRIPLRWVTLRTEEEAAPPDRRRREDPRSGLIAWIGMRFERDAEEAQHDGLLWVPDAAADTLNDERWWKGFLGVAAAFAAHSRTLSRSLFDHVTGLPDRAEFQAELELALARAAETKRPAVLAPARAGRLRLGQRAARPALRGSSAPGDRGRDPGGTSQPRSRGPLRRRDLHRHPPRHAGRRQPDRGGERRAAVERAAIPRGHPAAGVQRGCGRDRPGGADRRARADPARGPGVERGQARQRRQRPRLGEGLGRGARPQPRSAAGDLHRRQVDRLPQHEAPAGLGGRGRRLDRPRRAGAGLHGAALRDAPCPPGGRPRAFPSGRLRAPGGPRARGGRNAGLPRHRAGPGHRGEGLPGGQLRGRRRAKSPGTPSLCAMPLALPDRCLGGIVLEVGSLAVSFEGSDRKFLDALASEMAVALDRVRLLERERERQREEKERLEAEVTDLRRVVHGSRLAYRSAAIESLLATARKVAHTDTTVLITGESGTGKEMLASILHELSGRHERPMIVVDCSAISPTLIESELFGHERGAFTGAHARKPGRFAQADGSTVFLDEIGELPLDLQSKLLRFVQEKQFTPVGGVVPQTVDVRIVAATNVDLRAKVAEGQFRPDLFHRLNVVRLHVPPLRERREDIVHLAGVFLKQFAALYRRPAHHFTARAEEALEAYRWPGNVRELQNLILTSVLFCEAAEVDVEDMQGLHVPAAAETARERAQPAAPAEDAATKDAAEGEDPAARLRTALAREIAAALRSGRPRARSGRKVAGRGSGPHGRPALGRRLPARRGSARHPRHHVPAPAPGRGRSPGGRARRPLAALGRRDERPRGVHPGATGRDGRVRVGGSLPAGRDRRRGSGRRAHGRDAARRHGAHAAAPQSGTSRTVPEESARRNSGGTAPRPPGTVDRHFSRSRKPLSSTVVDVWGARHRSGGISIAMDKRPGARDMMTPLKRRLAAGGPQPDGRPVRGGLPGRRAGRQASPAREAQREGARAREGPRQAGTVDVIVRFRKAPGASERKLLDKFGGRIRRQLAGFLPLDGPPGPGGGGDRPGRERRRRVRGQRRAGLGGDGRGASGRERAGAVRARGPAEGGRGDDRHAGLRRGAAPRHPDPGRVRRLRGEPEPDSRLRPSGGSHPRRVRERRPERPRNPRRRHPGGQWQPLARGSPGRHRPRGEPRLRCACWTRRAAGGPRTCWRPCSGSSTTRTLLASAS